MLWRRTRSTKPLRKNNVMMDRLRHVVKKYAIILAVGVAYLVLVLCTGWGIPCPFYTLTGFLCPACGVSRMIVALVRLDFLAALKHHALLLVTLPMLLFCLIYPDVRYILKGERRLGWVSVLLWIEVGLLLIFGIVRNFIA